MRAALADVDGFYAAVGLELPGRGEKAPIRCFASPEAHRRADRNPSAEVDRGSGYWRCHGCGEWGGPYDAVLALGLRPAEAMELLERYGLKRETDGDRPHSRTRGNGQVPNGKPQNQAKPPASEDQLARWRHRLLRDERLLARLRELRGWTRPTIEALGLGFDGERVTFPVRGEAGELLDVLRYKPGNRADGERKLLASKGRQRGPFPAPERVEGGLIWIVEGEPDAVSAHELGIPATAIPGVNKWDPSWAERFAGRGVVVVLDCDREGREAAHRIAESLLPHVARVKVVDLDPAREDGYDLSDLLLEAGEGRDQARRMLLEMALEAPSLEPPEAVDGAELLDELVRFVRRFVVMSEAQARAVALWIMHTHAFEAAESTPYLSFTSAEKESGKTRALEVLSTLVARPWFTGRVTAAVLIRKIDAERPTLLLDESDAAFKGDKEYAEALRGQLNSGYRRGGVASLCVGQGAGITYKDFETFSAKAIAGIGGLPDTVASRSIPIRLERRAPGEKVERWRERRGRELAEPLRARLEAWAEENLEDLRVAEPEAPAELGDRAQDTAEPLLAIADLVGADWPATARAALVELHGQGQVEEDSIGVRLLADIRDTFDRCEADKLATGQLLEHLHALDESPWAEWGKTGKPLTPKGLADLLRRYRIRSRTIRLDEGTAKGFKRAEFEPVFARYLRISRHTVTTGSLEPKTAGSVPSPTPDVTAGETSAIPLQERDVTGVTAEDGFMAASEAELDLAERVQAEAKAA